MIELLRINGEFGSDADHDSHTSILDSIADGDGQRAAALARAHLLTLVMG